LIFDILMEQSTGGDDIPPTKRCRTLYILKCADNRWYVGTTYRHIYDRYSEHLRGDGSAWTKLHRPLKIEAVIENVDAFEEDKQTKMLMMKHGIANVRGGSYVAVDLPEVQMKGLMLEMCTAGNLCFRCGAPGHYADRCPKKQILIPIPDEEFNIAADNPVPSQPTIIDDYCELTLPPGYSIICSRCGSNGHSVDECTAPACRCARCGRDNHTIDCCYATYDIRGNRLTTKKRVFVAPDDKEVCILF